MKLVEFLIALLEAHAETLRRLSDALGEERLVALLDEVGETESVPAESTLRMIDETGWIAPGGGDHHSPYSHLEEAVGEMRLPPALEPYLWAYPHYRAFIESPIDLDSRIPGPGGEAGAALVEEAVAQAHDWVKRLPLPPGLSAQVERAAHVPWLRFRAATLKRVGRRPIGPVY